MPSRTLFYVKPISLDFILSLMAIINFSFSLCLTTPSWRCSNPRTIRSLRLSSCSNALRKKWFGCCTPTSTATNRIGFDQPSASPRVLSSVTFPSLMLLEISLTKRPFSSICTWRSASCWNKGSLVGRIRRVESERPRTIRSKGIHPSEFHLSSISVSSAVLTDLQLNPAGSLSRF